MAGRRLGVGETLVLATHNTGKVAELRALLEPAGVRVVGAGGLGLVEPDETADSFAGNAVLKATAAAAATGLAALADDSGFSVASLGGAPGVLSARWGGPSRDFGAAMRRVFEEAGGHAGRRAAFCCVLALAWPDGEVACFEGRVEGQWIWPPRGDAGFGYDPMFVPEGGERSFAEMGREEKALISHRARAFAGFAAASLPSR
jgi:XTP/dITP diphosphohydrolase